MKYLEKHSSQCGRRTGRRGQTRLHLLDYESLQQENKTFEFCLEVIVDVWHHI